MSEIVVGLGDAGRSLTLSPGDVVIVEVEENLGTGYSWAVADDGGGVLSQIESTHIPAPRQLMGAPGIHRFRFSAARAGTGTLELRLCRPWESSRAPAQRLRLPITVG